MATSKSSRVNREYKTNRGTPTCNEYERASGHGGVTIWLSPRFRKCDDVSRAFRNPLPRGL